MNINTYDFINYMKLRGYNHSYVKFIAHLLDTDFLDVSLDDVLKSSDHSLFIEKMLHCRYESHRGKSRYYLKAIHHVIDYHRYITEGA